MRTQCYNPFPLAKCRKYLILVTYVFQDVDGCIFDLGDFVEPLGPALYTRICVLKDLQDFDFVYKSPGEMLFDKDGTKVTAVAVHHRVQFG